MRLLIVSSAIAFAAVTAFAQEASSTAIVRREVFAEHSAINLVNTIVRTKRGGQDGVLIIGAGQEVSMSCFVPFGGRNGHSRELIQITSPTSCSPKPTSRAKGRIVLR